MISFKTGTVKQSALECVSTRMPVKWFTNNLEVDLMFSTKMLRISYATEGEDTDTSLRIFGLSNQLQIYLHGYMHTYTNKGRYTPYDKFV